MRKRWGQCDIIAKYLGLTKYQVFYKLYDDLVARGMLDDILSGLNIDDVKNLESYKNIIEPEELANDEKIKLAMWYLKKIGNPEEALRVLKLAIKVTK